MDKATDTQIRSCRGFGRRAGVAAVFAALALMLVPATGSAAPVKFGARLDPTVQPSNSLPGLPCGDESSPRRYACTMVQNEAYGRPNSGELAPRSGIVTQIRMIAGGPGTMRIETVKVKRSTLFGTKEGKLVHKGPKISYQGQTEANWESGNYRVETFKVHMRIAKGEQLAVHSNSASMVRCSSGGDNTLIYPLTYYPKHPYNAATRSDGCWLLVEATIR
jgi:hypothetical protein